MAPIHHHFELGGWPETTVIVRFWLLAGACAGHRARALLRRLHQHRRARLTDHLVLGLGVTGQAVLRALVAHGEGAVVVDDAPTDGGPRPRRRARACRSSRRPTPTTALCVGSWTSRRRRAEPRRARPPPGVRRRAPTRGVPVLSEFDLATRWDDRPLVAITGTDGKTTVTELARAMFEAGGRHAVAVGNTEVPFVAAIDDPTVDVFVVEASSFRLLHSHRFAPDVGHLAQPGARPPRPRRASAATPPSADYVAAKARHLDGPGAPTRSRSATPTTRSWRRELAPAPRPPGHLRARRRRRQPRSTAIGSCSTPATRSPRSTSCTAPSRTTSPTRWPRPPPSCTAAASVAARPRGAAGLPGAPPSGDAGGRGWRGALVRRLEGHRAPRHPWRRCAASTRSC